MFLLYVFGVISLGSFTSISVPSSGTLAMTTICPELAKAQAASPRTTESELSIPSDDESTTHLPARLPDEQPRARPQWQYDNETFWPGRLCQAGKGQRQSPINIRTSAVVPDAQKEFIKYGDLKLHGYQSVLVSGINNGRTIQFTMDGDEAMHPSVSGGPLHYLYRLEQVHFHWLSEHAINGYKYPMEIHFVHIRADLTTSEALRKRDGMAIIAVFGNIKSEVENDDEFIVGDAFEEVMRQLPHLTDPGDRVSGIVMNLRKLLAKNHQSYLAYSGSLTSPECNEVVTWIILESPVFMTYGQYKDFSTMARTRYNFRSLQVSNLTVYRPSLPQMQRPVIFGVFADMFHLVTDFFKNMHRMMQSTDQSSVEY